MFKKKRYDAKWYSEEFLQELKAMARVREDGDLRVIEKYAPDALSDKGIDPRLLNGILGRRAKALALLPNFVLDRLTLPLTPRVLKSLRKSCDKTYTATCVRSGVSIEDSEVAAPDGHRIPIRIYRSEACAPGCPCVYFMHGGAFVAGGIPPYDEAWKLFVHKYDMVVVSVDYRLMPEHPYPAAHEDCLCVLEWIHGNAQRLDIDKNRVFVTGDSAGGNLAQYCSTRTKGTGMVRGQLLLYPTLNAFGIKDKHYRGAGSTEFDYEPRQKRLSRCVTKQLEMMAKGFVGALGVTKPDPFINPYSSDASGNPPTFISVGALDYLRLDALAWAHRLQDAAVPVKVVVYNGMGHGYLSATGVFPQAEDVLDEMGAFIREQCGLVSSV